MGVIECEPLTDETTHLWASVFSDRPIEDGPFNDVRWEVFILPHQFLMDQESFRRLRAAAEVLGDDSVTVLSDDLQRSAVLDWDYESLVMAAARPVAVNDVYLVAASTAWGMVCTHADFSVLGGSATFMEGYAQEAGGREGLRREFVTWTRSPGWLVPTHLTLKLLSLARWDDGALKV